MCGTIGARAAGAELVRGGRVAVVLALASAVVYGASDFLGGLSSRRASVFGVVVLSQAVGLSMQNSSNQQHAMQQLSTATVTVAVKMILAAAK